MSGVTDSHKTAASVQSEKSVESAEPAEIVAVTQGETERRKILLPIYCLLVLCNSMMWSH